MMLIDGEDPAEAWSIKLQNNHTPEVDMGKKLIKKKLVPFRFQKVIQVIVTTNETHKRISCSFIRMFL